MLHLWKFNKRLSMCALFAFNSNCENCEQIGFRFVVLLENAGTECKTKDNFLI